MVNFKPDEKTQFHRDNHTNKTGFLGVTFKKRGNRYEARIRVPDRKGKLYCGSAATAEDAAKIYDKKARELFGSDAVTNFEVSL